jgi:stage II sporulation protein D
VRLARLLIFLVLVPLASPGCAQDFRVRLYTLHPPTEITVKASSGTLQWRTCPGCSKNSATLLSLQAAGSELRIRDAGISREIFISGAIRIEAAGQPSIPATFPLQIQASDGHLLLTAAIPIEDYVAAVLAGESGDFRNDESLKAMAVVVRTYATRFRGQHNGEGFDFCDTTHCQVPLWSSITPRITAAVDFTHGETLLFKGAAVSAFYHQNCGGTIAAGSEAWSSVTEPYLRCHPDPYCVTASPLKWESSLAVADMDSALRTAGLSSPAGWTAIEIVSRSESGRAQRLLLKGGTSLDTPISASSFRFAVNRALGWNKIRSDLYDLRNDGDHILFSGRGSGHGVGLCQAGAEEMARQGKDYRQILDFYFSGTRLSKTSADDWQKRTSERFELISTAPDEDSALLPVAEKILKENEAAVEWQLSFRAHLQVFPTLDRYRDATGQPGWVAATTRGQSVRLQPLAELRRRSILESTLRHEFFHLLIEPRARQNIPLWFREGLVLYLSEPDKRDSQPTTLTDKEMEELLRNPGTREKQEKAYAAARARVLYLIQQNGKSVVLDWLSSGIPRDALGRTAAAPDQGTSHHP